MGAPRRDGPQPVPSHWERGWVWLWGTPWAVSPLPCSPQTSVLCKAAVHAGVIADKLGGQVTLSREKGITLYESAFANGLHSKRWVRGVGSPGCTPHPAVGPIRADTPRCGGPAGFARHLGTPVSRSPTFLSTGDPSPRSGSYSTEVFFSHFP